MCCNVLLNALLLASASDLQLILGNDILTGHQAVLNCHTCTLVQGGKPVTLHPVCYSNAHSRLQQPVLRFLLQTFCSFLSNVSMQYFRVVTVFWLWFILQLPLACLMLQM